MALNARRLTYLTGLTGISIILLAALAAALVFRGPQGNPYSALNRNISALGHPNFSEWAILFNWSLRIGGSLLIGFMLGLSHYVRHWAMWIITLTGLGTTGGLVWVGICPATEQACHKAAALTVFASGFLTTTSFTAMLLFTHQRQLPKWLALPSALAILAFILFLLIPVYTYDNAYRVFFRGPTAQDRPFLWLPSLLEWIVFLAIVAWILSISLYLYWQEHHQPA